MKESCLEIYKFWIILNHHYVRRGTMLLEYTLPLFCNFLVQKKDKAEEVRETTLDWKCVFIPTYCCSVPSFPIQELAAILTPPHAPQPPKPSCTWYHFPWFLHGFHITTSVLSGCLFPLFHHYPLPSPIPKAWSNNNWSQWEYFPGWAPTEAIAPPEAW